MSSKCVTNIDYLFIIYSSELASNVQYRYLDPVYLATVLRKIAS